jgi:hypothetical protein
MKTNDLKELSPLEKVTLPTAAMPGRMDSLGRSMKRAPRRILGQFGGENAGGQAYHVMSRTAGGEMVFGEVEKEAFRWLMWLVERLNATHSVVDSPASFCSTPLRHDPSSDENQRLEGTLPA